ncbi:MAG: DUF1963 domain-containing protein [Variovorax sp.]
MFESRSEIEPVLTEAGLGAWAKAIEALCRPAVCFEASTAGAGGIGASRIGGLPDLPRDVAWPLREAYPHWQQIAAKLIHHGPALERGSLAGQPLHFVAQIALDEARTALRGDSLPDAGRLLFFWDANCGPWTESELACRVVWDRSPLDAIGPREAPAELASQDARRDFPRSFAEQPLSMLGIWSMPDQLLLQELLQDEAFDQMLDDGDCDEFWDEVVNAQGQLLASGREVLAHRLRGWPLPEQSDPRFMAAAAARGASFMLGSLSEEERAACEADMHDWSLLLQVGCTALNYAEGTVYFIMREADLEQRNFDRVHAVFQQT